MSKEYIIIDDCDCDCPFYTMQTYDAARCGCCHDYYEVQECFLLEMENKDIGDDQPFTHCPLKNKEFIVKLRVS